MNEIVPTGRIMQPSCSKPGAPPTRSNWFAAVVVGRMLGGKPFNIVFHLVVESECGAVPGGESLKVLLGA